MTITIMSPLALIRHARRERKIKKSIAKLAETTLVPGYTNVYA